MICLTSLFTTLKYYPNNVSLFHERILRYTRTLPRATGEVIVFEYVSVVRHPTHFDWVPVAEYRVDPEAESVSERLLDSTFSTRAAHAVSPLHDPSDLRLRFDYGHIVPWLRRRGRRVEAIAGPSRPSRHVSM